MVSIFNMCTKEHVLQQYFAESDVIAAYVVCNNELGTEFEDDEARCDFDINDTTSEFLDYGLALLVKELF